MDFDYKQSDIGTIPQDWDVVPFSEFITEFRGGAPLKPTDFKSTGVKVLPKGGVGRTGWLQIDNKDLQYCSPAYAAAHHNNQVDKGYTIVVLRDLVPSGPSIGLMVQIRENEIFVLAQGVYGFKVNQRVDSRYLVQLSNTYWYRQLMNSIMVGSTQVHITNTAFKSSRIPLPSFSEQRAIATALSDVDALLNGLGRLIAKKRNLKQASMQRLLTGETRLPGFKGEWEVKRLGELFNFSGGYSASRDQLSTEGYCYLHYGDIHGSTKTCIDTDADFQNIPKLDIPLKRVSPASLLDDGDVVFVDASEDNEGTSKHVVVVNKDKKPFISGLHTIVAKSKTDELAHEFRRYCFQTPAIREQFLFYSVGTKVSGISKSNIPKLTLSFPSVPEQIAIATVLSDMDAEIAALEQRRNKTKDIKQAMMQELLTGKIRLVNG